MMAAGLDAAWIEQAPCGYLQTSRDGTITLANSLFAGWCGRSAEALIGIHFSALLTPAGRIFYQTHCLPLLQLQGSANEMAFDLTAPGGARQAVLVNAIARRPAAGEEAGQTAFTVFSATETRRHEKALRDARRASDDAAEALARSNEHLAQEKERLRVTLYSIGDAVVTTDASGRIETMNAAAQALAGVAEAVARGALVADVCSASLPGTREPRDCPVIRCLGLSESVRSSVDVRLERLDGAIRWIVDTASPIFAADGCVVGAVWVARDTTEQRAIAARMAHEESHDALTGLLNRAEFERQANSRQSAGDAVSPPLPAGAARSVCVIDLDQFKLINDTVGNAIGDELLVQVAQRLRGMVRQSDVLARLGGDEFGLLLPGCSLEQAELLARSLCERFAQARFQAGERQHAISISIGVALLSAEAGGDAALAHANIACDAAKEAGRNRVVCFQAGDAALSARRGQMGWVARIRDAIESDRLELFYQPIVPIPPDRAAAPRGELLLRLRDNDDRLLAPGAFLPAAERYGQMQAIDRWVLRKGLAWMVRTPDVCCSINVSGQSLGDPDFLGYAVAQLDAVALPADRVCLEITETAAIGDLQAALRLIATLRERGVRFALDDFGCGMSSFSYLKTLSVDYLKIDGSFVKDIRHNPLNRAIVESIHRVAQVSGLQTVAEWVEDDDVLREVAQIGIDFAQGYGTGKPFAITDWAAYLARRDGQPAMAQSDSGPGAEPRTARLPAPAGLEVASAVASMEGRADRLEKSRP